MAKEHYFDGLGVAAGIAIGPAYVRESGAVDVPERSIPKKDVAKEQQRLKDAVRVSRRQIRRVQSRIAAKSGAAAEVASTLPSRPFGNPDAVPDKAARAAAMASTWSDLPWRFRIWRFGRSTSTAFILRT